MLKTLHFTTRPQFLVTFTTFTFIVSSNITPALFLLFFFSVHPILYWFLVSFALSCKNCYFYRYAIFTSIFISILISSLFLPVVDSIFYVEKFNFPNISSLGFEASLSFVLDVYNPTPLATQKLCKSVHKTGDNASVSAAWLIPDMLSLPKWSPIFSLFPFCCLRVHLRWNWPSIILFGLYKVCILNWTRAVYLTQPVCKNGKLFSPISSKLTETGRYL